MRRLFLATATLLILACAGGAYDTADSAGGALSDCAWGFTDGYFNAGCEYGAPYSAADVDAYAAASCDGVDLNAGNAYDVGLAMGAELCSQ